MVVMVRLVMVRLGMVGPELWALGSRWRGGAVTAESIECELRPRLEANHPRNVKYLTLAASLYISFVVYFIRDLDISWISKLVGVALGWNRQYCIPLTAYRLLHTAYCLALTAYVVLST